MGQQLPWATALEHVEDRIEYLAGGMTLGRASCSEAGRVAGAIPTWRRIGR